MAEEREGKELRRKEALSNKNLPLYHYKPLHMLIVVGLGAVGASHRIEHSRSLLVNKIGMPYGGGIIWQRLHAL